MLSIFQGNQFHPHGKVFDNIPSYMQTGIIAFRRKALIKFNAMKETQLEMIESIDMNRVLETGGKVKMVITESETIGVDTAEELNCCGKNAD